MCRGNCHVSVEYGVEALFIEPTDLPTNWSSQSHPANQDTEAFTSYTVRAAAGSSFCKVGQTKNFRDQNTPGCCRDGKKKCPGIMMCLLGRFGRQDLQLSRRHHRWKLLTPTVLWSIVILAMTPSLQGFGLAGIPVGSIGLAGGISLPRIQPQQGPEGASAGDLSSGAVQPRSLAAPGSWLKDRIKDGKKRVKQQVLLSETSGDDSAPLYPWRRSASCVARVILTSR